MIFVIFFVCLCLSHWNNETGIRPLEYDVNTGVGFIQPDGILFYRCCCFLYWYFSMKDIQGIIWFHGAPGPKFTVQAYIKRFSTRHCVHSVCPCFHGSAIKLNVSAEGHFRRFICSQPPIFAVWLKRFLFFCSKNDPATCGRPAIGDGNSQVTRSKTRTPRRA